MFLTRSASRSTAIGFIKCVTCSAEEEINNMKRELDKYGIQMPAFSKIGGILANELSVDEAAGKTQACAALTLLLRVFII